MNKNAFILTPALAVMAMLSWTYAQDRESNPGNDSSETAKPSNMVEYEMPHDRADFYTNGTVKAAAPWEVKRDPFWPINWTVVEPPEIIINTNVVDDPKTNDVPVVVKPPGPLDLNPPNWLGASRQLRVISKKKVGGTWLVSMADMGVKEPGSIITLEYKGNIYTWRIAEIHPDSIRYDRVNVRPK